jgi:hypothetical protein
MVITKKEFFTNFSNTALDVFFMFKDMRWDLFDTGKLSLKPLTGDTN